MSSLIVLRGFVGGGVPSAHDAPAANEDQAIQVAKAYVNDKDIFAIYDPAANMVYICKFSSGMKLSAGGSGSTVAFLYGAEQV